jgi:hypothetical protein
VLRSRQWQNSPATRSSPLTRWWLVWAFECQVGIHNQSGQRRQPPGPPPQLHSTSVQHATPSRYVVDEERKQSQAFFFGQVAVTCTCLLCSPPQRVVLLAFRCSSTPILSWKTNLGSGEPCFKSSALLMGAARATPASIFSLVCHVDDACLPADVALAAFSMLTLTHPPRPCDFQLLHRRHLAGQPRNKYAPLPPPPPQ